MTLAGIRRGVVRDYDDHRAIGTIGEPGGGQWFFHCSAIADGSRHIEIGADVVFELIPGRRGQWEATAIVKLATPGPLAG